jgi:ATP-dependent Clp protease ATP-binding subunit ClpA
LNTTLHWSAASSLSWSLKSLSIEESYIILEGLKESYEKHHGVAITNAAIKGAVDLSSRYITDRYLPDKALDLIDETAAYYKSINTKSRNMRVVKKIENELSAPGGRKNQGCHDAGLYHCLAPKIPGRQTQEAEKRVPKNSRQERPACRWWI